MRINERFFKLRRSAARSFVKLYANENSGVSVMSETTRVPGGENNSNSFLCSLLKKKNLKIQDRKGKDIGKEKNSSLLVW